MGSGPPSRTIARGKKPSSAAPGAARGSVRGGLRRPADLMPSRRGPRKLAPALFVTITATLLLMSLVAAGCDSPSERSALPLAPGDMILPGATYSADLDGDEAAELISVDESDGSLTITDGETVYESRERWTVVTATVGDTDRDGLLEIVTLLDDEEGRHLGLIAIFGGSYRERLVTSEIVPPPVALEIVRRGSQDNPAAAEGGGDVIVLTQETGGEPAQTVLRWNGFSFTAVEGTAPDTSRPQ